MRSKDQRTRVKLDREIYWPLGGETPIIIPTSYNAIVPLIFTHFYMYTLNSIANYLTLVSNYGGASRSVIK
jgi:hypothetical protein